MRVARAYQMKQMDKEAIEGSKIPSTLLMERAAKGIEIAVLELLGERETGTVAVFCGSGNNGGDGVAVARFLRKAGVQVRAFLVGSREKMTDDCREMERRLNEFGGCLEMFCAENPEQKEWCEQADVVVDALFGVGLNRDVAGDAATAIEWMNESRAKVVAADLASGVETDSGRILGCAVKADVTVTFTCAKPGHLIGKGKVCTGELRIHSIGIPEEIIEETLGQSPAIGSFDAPEAAEILPDRPADGHKGTFGKVYVLGGSIGLTGAPVFATGAAIRSGSGLVFAGVPEAVYGIVAGKSDEAMPYPLPCDEEGRVTEEAWPVIERRLVACDAALVGPGMGRSAGVEKLVARILKEYQKPLVVDADAIYAIRNQKELLKRRHEQGLVTVLTPHDGEFSYLGGNLSSAASRMEAAVDFACEYGCILVLKGHGTIVAAPDGCAYLNQTGNCGMAKGGSGDVLAGILVSFLGQKMEPVAASALGVWMHGRAGDLCADKLTTYAMRPMDLIEYLPHVFGELTGFREEKIL